MLFAPSSLSNNEVNRMSEIYNYEYYKNGCGPIAYENSEHWTQFFEKIADRIVKDIKPRTVLDAGCAMGYLVAALRDRGVDAYGIDISEYAISKVREDIRPFCSVGSLTMPLPDNLPQQYDLIVTIEVLEHLYANEGIKAIQNLCQYSDQIIFTSTPNDFTEPTHLNVQQREYWTRIFAENDFYDDLNYRPKYITPYSIFFRKGKINLSLIEDYERTIRRVEDNQCMTYDGKVYFNFGEGESEKAHQKFSVSLGLFSQKILIPPKCKAIRFDPIEGCGCIVWNLQVFSDSGVLQIKRSNGLQIEDIFLFGLIDPQFYFDDLPSDTHWVNISAEIIPIANDGWKKVCQYIAIISQKNLFLSEKGNELESENQEYINRCNELQSENQEYINRCNELQSENQEYIEQCIGFESQIQDYSNLVAYERGETRKLSSAYQIAEAKYVAISNAFFWKITGPIRKVTHSLKQCLRLIKQILVSIRKHGGKSTYEIIKNKFSRRLRLSNSIPVTTGAEVNQIISVRRSTITGCPIDKIETILVDEPVRRLNLVTDTINDSSLLGGVATALIIATEFVNRFGYELRIITRNTEVNPINYEKIISLNKLVPAKKVSFYSDYNRYNEHIDYKLEISPDDIFFATSWWSAKAIEETTIRKRFFYIIQEVETFFYNYGGERMLCEEVMNNKNIDFVVNSGYLNDYFKDHQLIIAQNSCYFEPAFSKNLYTPKNFMKKKKKLKLFFYSRPNNPRNLYSVGVLRLKKAVDSCIVDTDVWDIYCVGQDAPVIVFSNGSRSINLGQLSWKNYAEFLSEVDLGLCLMYTPHPSYPPYDVACSGGVVLSNKMLNKTEFPACKNVILADLDEHLFMQGFRDAVTLAKNTERRWKNYEESKIIRNWGKNLDDTMKYMKGKAESV